MDMLWFVHLHEVKYMNVSYISKFHLYGCGDGCQLEMLKKGEKQYIFFKVV